MNKAPFDELLDGLRGQAVLGLEVPAALKDARERCLLEVRKWM